MTPKLYRPHPTHRNYGLMPGGGVWSKNKHNFLQPANNRLSLTNGSVSLSKFICECEDEQGSGASEQQIKRGRRQSHQRHPWKDYCGRMEHSI